MLQLTTYEYKCQKNAYIFWPKYVPGTFFSYFEPWPGHSASKGFQIAFKWYVYAYVVVHWYNWVGCKYANVSKQPWHSRCEYGQINLVQGHLPAIMAIEKINMLFNIPECVIKRPKRAIIIKNTINTITCFPTTTRNCQACLSTHSKLWRIRFLWAN